MLRLQPGFGMEGAPVAESDIAQPSMGASSLISGALRDDIFDVLLRFVSVILGLLYAGPKVFAYIRNRYD